MVRRLDLAIGAIEIIITGTIKEIEAGIDDKALASILDIAEYLPYLMCTSDDETRLFCGYVDELAVKFASMKELRDCVNALTGNGEPC